MSDEQQTIKDQPPRLRLPVWSVLVFIAFAMVGAAIGVSGTDAMKANFFIYFNAVAIPAVVIVFFQGLVATPEECVVGRLPPLIGSPSHRFAKQLLLPTFERHSNANRLGRDSVHP
jgi:hypothetical protein